MYSSREEEAALEASHCHWLPSRFPPIQQHVPSALAVSSGPTQISKYQSTVRDSKVEVNSLAPREEFNFHVNHIRD